MELAYLDLEDPMPFAKMSECLIEAGRFAEALIVTEKAIERAGDNEEYATDKEKWLMTYDYLLSLMNVDPALVEKIRAERKSKNLSTVR